MKKVNVLLLPLLFILACSKKKEEVNPDLAAQVAGSYQVTYMEALGESFNLPLPGVSAGVMLSKVDNETVDMLITANVAGEITQDGGEVTLKRTGSKVTLFAPGSIEMGYVEGKSLKLDFVSADGNRVKVEAEK